MSKGSRTSSLSNASLYHVKAKIEGHKESVSRKLASSMACLYHVKPEFFFPCFLDTIEN